MVNKYFRPVTYLDYLRQRPKIKWLFVIAILLVIIWGGWSSLRTVFGLNAPKYRTVLVEEGPMVATIRASGTLNPVKSVTIGTGVSGMVKELLVDFNDTVKKGQLIARIDPRDYQARFDQANANYRLTSKNHQFNVELFSKGFISKQALIQTEEAQNTALGALNSAKKSLDDTFIRSPVDGVVVKRSVEIGQTVAATLQSPEIFVIAQDLADMQVETSIDESDVGRIKEGQSATFTVDAFPGRVFQGKVIQIRKAPINIQNVVTYTVLISANNPDLKLLPGMTANARIVVDEREKTLKVANSALRFRMPENDPAVKAADAKSAANAPNSGSNSGSTPGANAGNADAKSSKGTRPLAAMGIRRIWILEKSGLKEVPERKVFKIGITDGESTEILPVKEDKPLEIKVGDKVIIGIEGAAQTNKSAAPTAPRMF
jgi:HlyD family secretion protein